MDKKKVDKRWMKGGRRAAHGMVVSVWSIDGCSIDWPDKQDQPALI